MFTASFHTLAATDSLADVMLTTCVIAALWLELYEGMSETMFDEDRCLDKSFGEQDLKRRDGRF